MFYLILITTLLRLGFAWAVGLGVDESYMVASGRTLSLGYFDHPPASWWLSWGASHLLGTEAPIAVRLPFILLFALSTWLMFRLGSAVADRRVGFWAAALLNLSPVFGITSGTWVLPDGPLDCALLGAALCLVHALPARGWRALAWWGGAGICAGLALFSKYSAVLTISGALLYLATSRAHRFWLRRPEPYLAVILAAAVFAPVIVWNAENDWASFAFQGERAVGVRFRPFAPLTTLGGEALFVLPWIWLPMMILLLRTLRGGATVWRYWLLACLALPPIVVFAAISAWSSQRVLFHWAAPGYLMLFPLLAAATVPRLQRAWVRWTIGGTAALAITVVAVIGAQTRFDVLGDALAPAMRKDPTIEGIDWVSLRTDLTARGLLRPDTIVAVPNWRDGGKIAYALGAGTTVLCLNPDAREFGVAAPPARFVGQDVLVLAMGPADRSAADLARAFTAVETLPPATVRLNGRVLAEVAVLRGHGFRGVPAARM